MPPPTKLAPRAPRLPWIVLGVLVVSSVGGFVAWRHAQEADAEAASEARRVRREQRERERDERWEGVAAESADLIPPLLSPVTLGMRREAARAARPAMAEMPGTTSNEPGLTVLEERFPNGARAVYLFEEQSERLQRIQVLSLLPSTEAIGPHLTAMHEQYGVPTGVWNCPDTEGVPTRRFTWRHGQTTVSDVFLVYQGRISVTLYIAPSGVIQQSLRRARCRPVDRAEMGAFPVASPEQLNLPGRTP